MASLPESSTFDAGVYQLELTDPVIGGPSGVSNAPLKNLANRTKYLKDHVDALESTRAPLASPVLTGTPTAPTATQGNSTTQLATTAFVNAEISADAAPISHVGATGAAHGVATASVAGFMAAADKSKLDGIAAGAQANTVTSVAGRTGAVALAVGDVSGAAPLASPVLTGTPTAPTAALGTNTTQLATTAFVKSAMDNVQVEQAGQVVFFAMNSAPSGWLKANGAAVSRTAYAALFAAIGITHGAGDGSTTFNLPDLRGEFIRGWDDSRGVDAGRAFGSWQADEFRSHVHYTHNSGTLTAPYGGGAGQQADPTSAAGGDETRPRNIALLACIKF